LEELAPESHSDGALAVATAGNVGGLIGCRSDILVREITLNMDLIVNFIHQIGRETVENKTKRTNKLDNETTVTLTKCLSHTLEQFDRLKFWFNFVLCS